MTHNRHTAPERRIGTAVLYKDERMWFFGAVFLLCVLFGLYAYFVISSVVQVVIRKEIAQEIAETSSYVSQLESEYIKAQHDVSAEIAYHTGYVEAEDKTFIDRAPSALVLSFNNSTR